jgi:hypothetical protein
VFSDVLECGKEAEIHWSIRCRPCWPNNILFGEELIFVAESTILQKSTDHGSVSGGFVGLIVPATSVV